MVAKHRTTSKYICYYRLILLIEVSKHLDRPLILLICAALNCNWFVSATMWPLLFSLLLLLTIKAAQEKPAWKKWRERNREKKRDEKKVVMAMKQEFF